MHAAAIVTTVNAENQITASLPNVIGPRLVLISPSYVANYISIDTAARKQVPKNLSSPPSSGNRCNCNKTNRKSGGKIAAG